MGIISQIRQLLPSARKKRLSQIRDLPEGQRRAELGALFYSVCFDRAVRFVQGQIARGDDSPFRGAQRDRFFHEIMAVNFWALEKLLAGKHGHLMDQVYEVYAHSFPGARSSGSGKPDWAVERFALYDASWNDVTGHQDIFGRRVGEQIFGEGRTFSAPETSFWIIEHSHEALDDLRDLRGLCRRMRVPLS